jgi:hypothetical protein
MTEPTTQPIKIDGYHAHVYYTAETRPRAAQPRETIATALYGSPEISGRECRFDLGHIIGGTYKASEAGAQATAQSERIRRG